MAQLSFPSFSNRLLLGSAAVVAAAGGWVLFTYPPATTPFYPQCAFRMLTGLDCPGCGTTRALHHLLHGRIEEAFFLNPLLFVILLVALCAAPSVMRGERPGFLSKPWFGWGSFAMVAGWWVVRNL